jgi:hypothetical protein
MAFDIHTKFGIHCNAITAAELVEANSVDATLAEIVDRIAAAGFAWSYIDVEPVAIVPAGTALNDKARAWLGSAAMSAKAIASGARAFLQEFPDFPAEDMPEIPAGFEDVSWHNDSCPSFLDETRGMILFVDFAEAEKKEFPETSRFNVNIWDGGNTGTSLIESDDWAAVLAFIEQHGKQSDA